MVRNLPRLLSVSQKAEILRGQTLAERRIHESFVQWELGAENVHNGVFCLTYAVVWGSVEVKSGMNIWAQEAYLGGDPRKQERSRQERVSGKKPR